ncbi:anti-sigma factor [Novosphingobium sp. G106]|uniref:anti-sigma factor family protein n=1 Tax=Novosphingobium sp. G106 TaxID=2849500 RepID=UPI001C2D4EFE|nr:anti-sigma factor [Novosphingobium sp. G106]MBV1689478.1 anti-sigma factor [Novosphingobium sp. G106]
MLAAYADGELDAETARTVESEIAGDPRLQADLVAHRALRTRLAAHFAPITEQAVPERLRQAVFSEDNGADIIDFATQARERRERATPVRWARIAGPALAASLVIALIGIGTRPADTSYAHGDLAQALDSQLVATQKGDAPVRILLSFQDKQGHYCRGFTGEARSGIACRNDDGWRLLKTFDSTKGDRTEYRQAGSAEIMTTVQDMAAGEALDAEQEARAAQLGWRPRQDR